MKPRERLRQWLEERPAPWRMGQLLILEGFHLRHADETLPEDSLIKIESLEHLRDIVKCDAAGNFRPLRSAPNLRSGWSYGPLSFSELYEALNFVYPAAIANWSLFCSEALPVIEYAETAERQTGMYRVTRTLTSEQLGELVQDVCQSGCLKQRLWHPNASSVTAAASEIRLLCPEACNYFIAKARAKLKGGEGE